MFLVLLFRDKRENFQVEITRYKDGKFIAEGKTIKHQELCAGTLKRIYGEERKTTSKNK